MRLICDHAGYAEMTGKLGDKKLAPLAENALVSAGVGPAAASGFVGVRFCGKFQEANAKNKNGRIYPREVLEYSIRPVIEAIESCSLFGEFDHPDTPVIHLKNSSHVITRLYWRNNELWGEGETIPTPWGMVLEQLLLRSKRPGISSRGVGDGAMREGAFYIQPGFRMITWDSVADPSTIGSYIDALHGEGYKPTKEDNFHATSIVSPSNNVDIDVAQSVELYLRERIRKG